jgi:hypothetical protein
LEYPIPEGWRQARGATVRRGDRIRTDTGWVDADDLGRSQVTGDGRKSAVGHPTALYACVIRKSED